MPKPFGAVPQIPTLSATPSANPPSGAMLLYFKTDGFLYQKTSAGVESKVDTTGGSGTLAALTDVALVSAAAGDVLRYDGSKWVDAVLLLSDLPDAWTKRSVRVATTTNLASISTLLTIDGITVVAGDRVLVKNQTSAQFNGIYIASATTWLRATDADTASEIAGGTVNVDQGTQGGQMWTTRFKSTDTLGTTAMVWNKVLESVDVGTAAAKNTPASGNAATTEVVLGSDTRLTDARTPSAHTHVATTDLTATGTKDATTFLRGDNTWAVPPGASPGISPSSFTAKGDLLVGSSAGSYVALGAPSSAQDGYQLRSDSTSTSGLAWSLPNGEERCIAATTGNISLSGSQSIDGVTVGDGNTVLVKDQATPAENGLYTVSSSGAWSRLASANTAAKIAGVGARVHQGVINGGSSWRHNFMSSDAIGSGPMFWFQISNEIMVDDVVTGNPAVPSRGLTVFSRNRGRRLLAAVGPTGQDTRYQPFIASNRVALWQAVNNATTSTTMGAAFTALNNATATPSAVAVASTSFYTSMVRERFATTATAGTGAGLRSATAQWMLSATANMGGFHYVCRFGLAGTNTNTRGFFGMSSQTGAYVPGTNPSAQLNQIGFYWDAGQTNIRFITAGTAVGTADVLGNNFIPTAGAGTYFYEAAIFCPSGAGQSGSYAITRLNDGIVATGTFGTVGATASTTMPLPSVLLSAHANYSNGTNAAAYSVDIQSLYIESDN